MELTRSTNTKNLHILDEGNLRIVNSDTFLKHIRVAGIIRIQKEDYAVMPKERLTHFNLEVSHNEVGKIYALPLIVEHGSYSDKGEILPVLSFKDCPVAECISCRENVPYDELTEEDFKHSFSTIKNVDELKEVILERYRVSLPGHSDEELLSKGVSVTELKIL